MAIAKSSESMKESSNVLISRRFLHTIKKNLPIFAKKLNPALKQEARFTKDSDQASSQTNN